MITINDIVEDIMTSTWESGRVKIINLCKQMCDKQREICFKKAVIVSYIKSNTKGSRYRKWPDNYKIDTSNVVQKYQVEKNSILNAPYPEELQ